MVWLVPLLTHSHMTRPLGWGCGCRGDGSPISMSAGVFHILGVYRMFPQALHSLRSARGAEFFLGSLTAQLTHHGKVYDSHTLPVHFTWNPVNSFSPFAHVLHLEVSTKKGECLLEGTEDCLGAPIRGVNDIFPQRSGGVIFPHEERRL